MFWSTLSIAQIRLMGKLTARHAESAGPGSLWADLADQPASENSERTTFQVRTILFDASFDGHRRILFHWRAQVSELRTYNVATDAVESTPATVSTDFRSRVICAACSGVNGGNGGAVQEVQIPRSCMASFRAGIRFISPAGSR